MGTRVASGAFSQSEQSGRPPETHFRRPLVVPVLTASKKPTHTTLNNDYIVSLMKRSNIAPEMMWQCS